MYGTEDGDHFFPLLSGICNYHKQMHANQDQYNATQQSI
jgi:hypothetical protein